jgi:hypothetical protein
MRIQIPIFILLLLASCNSTPIESRLELLSSPPSQSFMVGSNYEKIASDWDNDIRDIFSLCLVDFEQTTTLVKVPGKNIYEIRTRNQFGPYYGLIQLREEGPKKTKISIYDWGALPCFTKKIVPFFERYTSR